MCYLQQKKSALKCTFLNIEQNKLNFLPSPVTYIPDLTGEVVVLISLTQRYLPSRF